MSQKTYESKRLMDLPDGAEFKFQNAPDCTHYKLQRLQDGNAIVTSLDSQYTYIKDKHRTVLAVVSKKKQKKK